LSAISTQDRRLDGGLIAAWASFAVAALNKFVKDSDHKCDENSAVAAMLEIADTS
jgi:hypothetical protein